MESVHKLDIQLNRKLVESNWSAIESQMRSNKLVLYDDAAK
jgi:hypothetical protein